MRCYEAEKWLRWFSSVANPSDASAIKLVLDDYNRLKVENRELRRERDCNLGGLLASISSQLDPETKARVGREIRRLMLGDEL